MSTIAFQHTQTAHCESGAVSALLRHEGLDLSEPMVFGLSSALIFVCIPLLKIGGMPLLTYRMPPGRIIRGISSRLGAQFNYQRFRQPAAGMQALDRHLANGRPVGLQASVFWLPYFPEDMRFHFNAHNLVAYGRRGDSYLISDPTFEHPVEAEYQALQRARFVRGMLAPKGLIYYPESLPDNPDLARAISAAIRATTRMMLHSPFPFVGVRGICYVARRIRRMRADQQHRNQLVIGHMVRMQEEIGTGGAGFRFLFASFLQESADRLGLAALNEAADQFSAVGDEWRRYALYAAKMLKGRMELNYGKLADQLLLIADLERQGFTLLEDVCGRRGLFH